MVNDSDGEALFTLFLMLSFNNCYFNGVYLLYHLHSAAKTLYYWLINSLKYSNQTPQ